MDPKQLQDLIHRYQNGSATPEERQLLDAHWQKLMDQRIIDNLSAQERLQLEKKMYRGIVHAIRQEDPYAFQQVRRLLGQPWMAMAASLSGLLLVMTALWFWWGNRSTELEFQTAFGEKKHVLLPEGSEVWLNGHSSLRYAPDSAGNRQVWLEGEAQFSVKHTATHQKFIVHTANQLAIEVLGTVFNVVNRREVVNVVLRSGSVRIVDETHRHPDILLKPNEMVSQSRTKTELAKTPIRAQSRLAWKDGAMYVENKPLGEIFDWIQDTYGFVITCSPALRNETFAGTIPTDSIESFFEMIAKLYQVDVHKNGQAYQID